MKKGPRERSPVPICQRYAPGYRRHHRQADAIQSLRGSPTVHLFAVIVRTIEFLIDCFDPITGDSTLDGHFPTSTAVPAVPVIPSKDRHSDVGTLSVFDPDHRSLVKCNLVSHLAPFLLAPYLESGDAGNEISVGVICRSLRLGYPLAVVVRSGEHLP